MLESQGNNETCDVALRGHYLGFVATSIELLRQA